MKTMKTIGLLGGMSWESTVPYYRLINQEINRRLGALHSARIILYSVEFEEIEQLQHAGDWQTAAQILIDAARGLEQAGADVLLICTNTMHRVYDQIAAVVGIPMLHIADATADAIRQADCGTVGLLGTRFTMEGDFYRDRLRQRHGLDVLIPEPPERQTVHRVIYDELCHGQVKDSSRAEFRRIIERLVARGAEGVILGCTEISMLVDTGDAAAATFDTTEIHALAAARWALDQS